MRQKGLTPITIIILVTIVLTLIIGAYHIGTQKGLGLIFLTKNKIVPRPPQIYNTEEDCIPHIKPGGRCVNTKCIKGESDGSRYGDGSTNICSDTWDGWIPTSSFPL